MKIHLHADDGAYHAAHGRLDHDYLTVGDGRDDLEMTVTRADRCRLYARYWWPHGGKPE